MMSWRKLSNILSWRGLQKARADLGDQGMSLELQWGGTWDRGTGHTGQEKEMVSSTDKLYEPRGLAGSCLHSANHIYPVRSFLSIFFLFSWGFRRIRFSGQDKRHSSHHYLRQSSKKRLISRNENMPRQDQDQDRFQKASCQDERPRSFITLSKEYKESLCQSGYILRLNPSP